jgi:hypothetical protein
VVAGGFPNGSDTFLNASRQVPSIPGLPGLVDAHTDQALYTRTGFDGETYNLVFSDEFNTGGRTFWPGDDPFWCVGPCGGSGKMPILLGEQGSGRSPLLGNYRPRMVRLEELG